MPHLIESAAMIYMLAAVSISWSRGQGQRMPMPGMAGGSTGTAGSFQVLAVVLALFMAGYVLSTADQLTSRARDTTTATTTARYLTQPGTGAGPAAGSSGGATDVTPGCPATLALLPSSAKRS